MNNKRLSKWLGIAGAAIVLGAFVVFLCVKTKNSAVDETETSESISLPIITVNENSELPPEFATFPLGPWPDGDVSPEQLLPEEEPQP